MDPYRRFGYGLVRPSDGSLSRPRGLKGRFLIEPRFRLEKERTSQDGMEGHPTSWWKDPSLGTQAGMEGQPTSWWKDPSLGTQAGMEGHPTSWWKDPSLGTQAGMEGHPTSWWKVHLFEDPTECVEGDGVKSSSQ
eukprot:scaffold153_cov347-Pavlova_lutheri.AAC.35